VTLLGDACHPMTPYHGTRRRHGDRRRRRAVALAPPEAVERDGCGKTAFRRFEASRKDRTERVQQNLARLTYGSRRKPTPTWVYAYDAWTTLLVA